MKKSTTSLMQQVWLKHSNPSMRHLLGLILLFSLSLVEAKEIHPFIKLHTSGFITDVVLDKTTLYVATDEGTVDLFSLGSNKRIRQIIIPLIHSGRGENIPPKIISIDRMNHQTLIVSISEDNFRNVWIEEDGKLTKLFGKARKTLVKEAYFLDKNHIVFGTFDSDIILYNITEGYNTYQKQHSQSTLTDIIISADKKSMVVADESGRLKRYEVRSGKLLEEYKTQHVDKVYSVAYANGVLVSGAEDRRVGVYVEAQKPYHFKTSFLVYAVGVSPSGRQGLYSDGEAQVLQLFDTKTKEKGNTLVGHKEIVQKILFVGEKAVISIGARQELFLWRLE